VPEPRYLPRDPGSPAPSRVSQIQSQAPFDPIDPQGSLLSRDLEPVLLRTRERDPRLDPDAAPHGQGRPQPRMAIRITGGGLEEVKPDRTGGPAPDAERGFRSKDYSAGAASGSAVIDSDSIPAGAASEFQMSTTVFHSPPMFWEIWTYFPVSVHSVPSGAVPLAV
jgi:hypothetical protein